MAKQIFINLPVKDLQKSMDFYTALGFKNNPQFSDDAGKCMAWSDEIFLMLLKHEKFSTFITKPIADTKATVAGLFSLMLNNLEEVDGFMENGLRSGGNEPKEKTVYDFMVQRTLEDLDGHTWEVFFMDMSKYPAQ